MDKKIRLLTHYRPLRALLVVVAVFLLGLGLRPAAPALAACGSATVVTTEAQLNTAIDDFNLQAGPCAYEIEFGADIILTAATQLINNSNAGISLEPCGRDPPDRIYRRGHHRPAHHRQQQR